MSNISPLANPSGNVFPINSKTAILAKKKITSNIATNAIRKQTMLQEKPQGIRSIKRIALLMTLPLCLLTTASCASSDSKKPDSPVVAKISTTPFVIAEMPTTISTDGSTVPGNVKVEYSYDTDGDGNFETMPESNYQESLSYTFPEEGKYKVGVKIQDETGQTSTASIDFTVYPKDYLSADKKSELKVAASVIGSKAIIQTQVDAENSNVTLRVYLNGKDARTATVKEDIKVYGPWETSGKQTFTKEVDVSDLAPGKYNATVSSDTGPEKDVSLVVK